MSIESKAKQAAGRAKCDKCKFWVNQICIDPRVAEVCYENFVKGYIKGYNQRRRGGKQMSRKKMMLTQWMAASLMVANSNDRGPHYSGYQAFAKREFKCGLCKNYPKGTFCKLAGHRVSRFTPAYKCDKFEFNEQKRKENKL